MKDSSFFFETDAERSCFRLRPLGCKFQYVKAEYAQTPLILLIAKGNIHLLNNASELCITDIIMRSVREIKCCVKV